MVVPWRNRAKRSMQARLREGLRPNGDLRPHYIVCGQDPLAYHLVNTLVPGSARVTVIVPPGRRPVGPDIAAIRGVRSIRAERIDEDVLRAAGLAGAAGLALMQQDDVGNIHVALTAQEIAPDVRVVMRMFNTGLGYGVKRLLGDCEVISDAAMAAPTFVAAALGELAPTHFHHLGRTLFVARRADVRPEHVVCGLADTSDPLDARMLPADPASADVVLAEATGEPAADVAAARRITRSRRLRRPFRSARKALGSFVTRKIGIATISVLAVGAIFGYLLSRAEAEEHLSPWQAIYSTLLTAITGADVDLDKGLDVQLMQLVLTIAGLALIPLITAAVVEGMVNARLALARRPDAHAARRARGRGRPRQRRHPRDPAAARRWAWRSSRSTRRRRRAARRSPRQLEHPAHHRRRRAARRRCARRRSGPAGRWWWSPPTTSPTSRPR